MQLPWLSPYLSMNPDLKPITSKVAGRVDTDWRGGAAVNTSIEGLLWLAHWAGSAQSFETADEGTRIPSAAALITTWLPAIYKEFFDNRFTVSKSSVSPGVRFACAALAEMGLRKQPEAITQMYIRYRK